MVQAGGKVLVALCVGLTAFVIALERNPVLARRWIPGHGAAAAEVARSHGAHAGSLHPGSRPVPRPAQLGVQFLLSFVMFLCFALALADQLASCT